ncbi:LysR family transcriptional regulator [Sphingomonas abietis]|uniref:LysR family transcriptional regulator n=1 Tax=Sphingomonas abietis TaxID=3012344 RepID=A0ABY7NMQ5_9SPHN|nr:LysR family transcriptional regulator [Sphingomonas abietis]WBO21766.1 LysR family transcriptional regulator [Sphingomonas abietis]
MRVFTRIVETGSFSEAGRRLHMTASAVGKMVGRIETRLGVRLIERSTRRLSLTDAGQLYHDRCFEILQEMDDLDNVIASGGAEISGTIRISASVGYGIYELEPLLPEFWAQHPKVTIDLSLSDEVVDLYLERTDLAFRVGTLSVSNLVATKLGRSPRIIVGSPDYLARHGVPRTIAELDAHNCLGFNFRRSVASWPLEENGRAIDRAVSGNFLANSGEGVRRMAVHGVGLARIGQFHAAEDIKAGRLVRVLEGAAPRQFEEVFAVHTGGPSMSPRLRTFLDFVTPRLRASLACD